MFARREKAPEKESEEKDSGLMDLAVLFFIVFVLIPMARHNSVKQECLAACKPITGIIETPV